MLHGEPVSEEDFLTQLISLDAKGRFEEAQAKILAYMKEEPDAGELAYKYASDLIEEHGEDERGIAFIEQILPGLEKATPAWAARLANKRGIAIVFGRYKKTLKDSDLAEAKRSFERAVRLNPDLSEANFHLGVINGIQGDVKKSKASFNKSIQTSASPDMTAAMKEWVAIAERDPDRFCKMMRTFYTPAKQDSQ